jgi:ribosome-binding protein aMBF1 (putative translation factor)
MKRDPYTTGLVGIWTAQLKREREKLGLSIAALAEIIGCSWALLRAWEAGQRIPRIEWLIRWSEAHKHEFQLVHSEPASPDNREATE